MKTSYLFMGTLIILFLSACAREPAVREVDPVVLQLEEAIKQNPNDPQRRVKLANVYVGKYQETKQKPYLDRATEEAREAIRLEPSLADAHALLVAILAMKAFESHDEGLIDEAKRAYEEALTANPELASSERFDPPHVLAAMILLN
jgi:tetratricopeptide (TPR) repeat protein